MIVLLFDDELAQQSWHPPPGVELHVRASAEAAAEAVEALDPDVVLMDYDFGPSRYSGAAAVAALRRTWDAQELVIVGISSSPEANALLVRAGANRSMPKGAVRAFVSSLVPPGEGA